MELQVINCIHWSEQEEKPSCALKHLGPNPPAFVCMRTCNRRVERQVDTATLWRMLHTRALNVSKIIPDYEAKWIAGLIDGITPDCPCHEHWAAYLLEHPPQLQDRDRYFIWTVKAHNAVNKRLGKRTLTVAEARAIYAPEGQGIVAAKSVDGGGGCGCKRDTADA